MEQISIFDVLCTPYSIKGMKINLIELFAGIGSQAKAIKNLGLPFVHARIAEWAIPSILAYASIHRDELPNYGKDYTKKLTKPKLVWKLFKKGVSANYNEPAKLEQLKRMNEDKLRLIYNSILWERNVVDITRANPKSLGIKKKEGEVTIFCYSFPCQDISAAGKRAGMVEGTRSGLVYEVIKKLDGLKELGMLPEVLLMENVKGVYTEEGWIDLYNDIERLGYTNFRDVLNSKDYGIPQNRERAFMVSILGRDVQYKFPKKQKLKLRLKDMLEDEVDEKYYLTQKQIEDIKQWNSFEKPFERMKVMEQQGISLCLTTRTSEYTSSMILVKNDTKKGYLEAEEGDGVDISSRMEYHRGTVQKGMTQTLTTMGGVNNGVVVKANIPNYSEKSLEKISKNIVDVEDIAGTITATGMQSANHDGCQLIEVELKRGYSCKVKKESTDLVDGVDVLGHYSKCNWNQQPIVGKNGIAAAVTGNHSEVMAIVEEKDGNNK